MREHIIQIDAAACVGCGACVRDCPAFNLTLADQKAAVISQDCIKCGHCVAVCPQAAVTMTGFDQPPVELTEPARLDPGQLLDALRTRRSIRQFTGKPVPPEAIAQVIEAGRLTPTGGNAQNVSYLVLRDGLTQYEALAVRLFRRPLPLFKLTTPSARRAVVDDQFFFKGAPCAILVLSGDKVNGALAAANMALTAEAGGLGVLYSGFFAMAVNHSPALRRALGLKRGDKVAAALVLGYSAVKYRRTAQKDPASVRFL